ncbi:hypothetical protein E0Z10_g10375, partial [Xylaria hypoxylon]
MGAFLSYLLVSQKGRPQSPDSDAESDRASESTIAVPDGDGTCSPPPDFESIGSDLWNSENHDIRAHKFFDAVNWQALASIATGCRDGIQCSYLDAEGFSMGQFNMVRRLDFVDGVRWVARVQMPPGVTSIPLERYNGRRAHEIEVASMKFF